MLIDCHSHIHVDAFDADRAEVIQRARDAGVSTLINVGFDIEGNFKAIALAEQYDFIYATMGIHPHLASDWNDDVANAIEKACLRNPKIVALGELGLDYYKNFQPRDVQITALRGQFALAQKLDLPVIIHCRDAFADLFEILPDYKLPNVLLHCFTGTMKEAELAWSRGYYTAFTGIVTYPSAKELQAVAIACPIDKLVVETDCPYLAPQSRRGQRNEPAFLVETAQKVADLRKMPLAELENTLKIATFNLFRLDI